MMLMFTIMKPCNKKRLKKSIKVVIISSQAPTKVVDCPVQLTSIFLILYLYLSGNCHLCFMTNIKSYKFETHSKEICFLMKPWAKKYINISQIIWRRKPWVNGYMKKLQNTRILKQRLKKAQDTWKLKQRLKKTPERWKSSFVISLVFLPTTSENLKPIGFSQCPPKMPDCCPMTKHAQDYVQWPPAPLLQFEVQKVWQFMHCWPAKVHFEFWGHHKMGKSSTCLKAKIANKKGSMLHQDTWYLLCIDIACKNPSGNSVVLWWQFLRNSLLRIQGMFLC